MSGPLWRIARGTDEGGRDRQTGGRTPSSSPALLTAADHAADAVRGGSKIKVVTYKMGQENCENIIVDSVLITLQTRRNPCLAMKSDSPDAPSPLEFTELGADEILKISYRGFSGEFERRWMSSFGTTPVVCAILWRRIDPERSFKGLSGKQTHQYVKPIHLLWTLLFLKVYGTESVMRSMVGTKEEPVTEKTFRKWTDLFVRAISFLESDVVSLLFALLSFFFPDPYHRLSRRSFGVIVFLTTSEIRLP